jgi:hypothetical protein
VLPEQLPEQLPAWGWQCGLLFFVRHTRCYRKSKQVNPVLLADIQSWTDDASKHSDEILLANAIEDMIHHDMQEQGFR